MPIRPILCHCYWVRLVERLEAEAEAQAEAQRRLFQAWFAVDVCWPCIFIYISWDLYIHIHINTIYTLQYVCFCIILFASLFCFLFLADSFSRVIASQPLVNVQFGCNAKASAGAMSLQYCRDHGRNSLSRFFRKITIDMSNLDALGCTWCRHCVPSIVKSCHFMMTWFPVGKSEGYTFRHWRKHQRATRHLQLWTPRNLGSIMIHLVTKNFSRYEQIKQA